MRLDHEFRVPAPLADVWAAVLDPRRVAPCMPGATLTGVDGDTFTGTVKVKLGPISLTYKGKGEFVERDEAAHRVVIKASGKDAQGNGTASAAVTLTLSEDGGETVGAVETDLSITGKPAQFGRGLIAEVGGKILDAFATCLSRELAPPDEPPAPREPAEDAPGGPPPVQQNAPTPTTDQPTTTEAPSTTSTPTADPSTTPIPTTPTAGPSPASTHSPTADPSPAVPPTAAPPTSGPSTPAPSTTNGATPGAGGTGPAAKPTPRAPAAPPAPDVDPETGPEAEPIDLMELAGASVAKRAVPVAVLLAVIGVVVAVIRRKRG